jgi:hypothetical protein
MGPVPLGGGLSCPSSRQTPVSDIAIPKPLYNEVKNITEPSEHLQNILTRPKPSEHVLARANTLQK